MSDRADLVDSLSAKYRDRSAVVAVIGLGYVGLPLAKGLLSAGFRVIGFDIDDEKVSALKRGKAYIRHMPSKIFVASIEAERFTPTSDFSKLHEADAILICVPTPLTKHREPDLTFVEKTAYSIAQTLRRGQLVVLESTTYPGTSRDIIKPILERSKLRCEIDFFIAYSPEREDPGNTDYSTETIPKVMGGNGPDSLRLAQALYSSFIAKIVPVTSMEAAEAVKLTENIFRSVNIALVNELKILYSAMGIDIWEVIEAAKTKPFGYMAFYPGPGLGGHCIPIDPFYLTWKAREYELSTKFIELAGEINTMMPRYVVARTADELDSRMGRGLRGAKILIVGLAYKKNVDDTRESPSLKLIELLENRGASCDIHDPHVPTIPPIRDHPDLAGRQSVMLTSEAVSSYDAVLIATDHDSIDYKGIVESAKLVIDTRNACIRAGAQGDNVAKA